MCKKVDKSGLPVDLMAPVLVRGEGAQLSPGLIHDPAPPGQSHPLHQDRKPGDK